MSRAHEFTLVVTRPPADAAQTAAAAHARGFATVVIPLFDTEPVPPGAEQRKLLAGIPRGEYSWIVFSSRRAVRHFAALLTGEGIALPDAMKIAVVGGETGEAATAQFSRMPALIASLPNGDLLARDLIACTSSNDRLLIPCVVEGRDEMAALLEKAGRRIALLPVYRRVDVTPLPATVETLQRCPRDRTIVSFFSPSAVTRFREIVPDADEILRSGGIVVIGRTTEQTVREAGFANVVRADSADVDGVIDAAEALAGDAA